MCTRCEGVTLQGSSRRTGQTNQSTRQTSPSTSGGIPVLAGLRPPHGWVGFRPRRDGPSHRRRHASVLGNTCELGHRFGGRLTPPRAVESRDGLVRPLSSCSSCWVAERESRFSVGVFPRRLCTPEHDADKEKRDWSDDSVSNNADVPDLHIRKWDADQACETQ